MSSGLVLRRSEVKENRKRWHKDKVEGQSAPQVATHNLRRAIAEAQPEVAQIVTRAQRAKELERQKSQPVEAKAEAGRRLKTRS